MISNYFETFILSIVQGISEFIPVSSSAHLILISELSNFSSSSLIIDVGLHLGSLLAIIVFFRKDLLNFFNNKSLALLIIIGSLPIIVIGLLLYTSGLIYYLRNIEVIAWSTLFFGILLYFADNFKITKKFNENLSIKNIFVIGLFQILALIPGVSRSGIVITAGRFLNFNRVLCLAAHPDDVEYGMLGSIMKYTDTKFDILVLSEVPSTTSFLTLLKILFDFIWNSYCIHSRS